MREYKIEIKWAIIFSSASFLWIAIAKYLGMFDSKIEQFPTFSMLFLIPAILIFVSAIRDKKMNFYRGGIMFKDAFVSGLIITLIVTLLTPIIQFAIHSFVAPEYLPNMINYSVAKNEMNPEDAENFFSISSYIIQSSITSLGMGAFTSIVVAFFFKSKTKKSA
jgi:hypothetical protein